MLNDYIEKEDHAVIHADGNGKYCLDIYVNIDRLKKMDCATNGYWKITLENNEYKIYTLVDNKKLYLNELLAVDEFSFSPEFIPELNEENIDKYTLKDIINSNDEENKKYILNKFKDFLIDTKKDRIGRRTISNIDNYINALENYKNNNLNGKMISDLNYTLEDICYDWASLELSYTSKYLFDNSIVFVYPKIKELIAAKNYKCDFSGFRIYKGNTYYRCKIFIENITDKSVYVTKELCISEDYIDYFPTDIESLDDFLYRIDSCYDRDDEEYYIMSVNMSDTHLGLKLLKKK